MSVRVLDVGAHDGFLSRWLLDQFPGARIDAIELNTQAAAICQQRLADRGTCKVGAAEDAPTLFEPGSYDAVCAFEVLEHVPDIPRFLTALERMVKPEGRVYLSTPDGCFGEGNNPHHLRALRAVDVADLLRRRGRLVNMLAGSDGVTAACYTPGPRKEDIGIYTGGCWQPWSPTDIERKGLGGSETAAVRLAESLSELGFVVTVYGDCEQTCYRDVIFRHHSTFDPLDRRGGLICSRIPEVGDRLLNAAVRMLWSHDVDFADRLTPKRADSFDHILGLSAFHCAHLRGRYPFAAAKVLQTRNGIHHAYFQPKPWRERAKRVMYTSSPDRGLDVLLEEWPRILERSPGAQLAYCYPDVYDAVADQQPAVAEHRDRIRALADQPGVTRLGALPQPILAGVLCESRVWAHPSWASMHAAPFHETSCIAAMEAQAAGCHVVASDWGALRETVRHGRLVNSDPPNRRWRDAFVTHIVEGLERSDVGELAVTRGPEVTAELGWQDVAVRVGRLVAAGDHR